MTTTTSNKTTTIEKENKTTENKRIKVTKPFEMMMNALALSRDLWKKNQMQMSIRKSDRLFNNYNFFKRFGEVK